MQLKGHVRELMLTRAAREWRGYHRRGILRRLFSRFLRFHPPQQLHVTEHTWDGEARVLAGPAIGAWLVDERGVRPADGQAPAEPGNQETYSTVFRVRFGIAPAGTRVLWAETQGPRAGFGVTLTLSGEGNDLRVARSEVLWKS